MELQICHVGDQNGAPLFSVVRSGDLKRTARSPFRRRSPFRWGRRGSGASSEASLVPEGYLQAPFGAYRQSAQAVAETLQAWGGRSLTGSSWARPRAGIRLPEGKASGTSGLRSPAIRRRSWPGPWEALYSRGGRLPGPALSRRAAAFHRFGGPAASAGELCPRTPSASSM